MIMHTTFRNVVPMQYDFYRTKTVLPSLKSPAEKALQSYVIYQINYAACNTAYVEQIEWHIMTSFNTHCMPYARLCGSLGNLENVRILSPTSPTGIRGPVHWGTKIQNEHKRGVPKLYPHNQFMLMLLKSF